MSTQAAPTVFGTAIQGDRSDQQDSFRSVWLKNEQAWLLLIADGMGGHASGGVASKVAADTFVAAFISSRNAGSDLKTALHAGLNAANDQIKTSQSNSFELRGMGTTLVAAYLSSDHCCWVSVGDSPLWQWSGGRLERLNSDHSLRSLVPAGKSARSNLLTSALTGETINQIDYGALTGSLRTGDYLLLGSDGILTLEESEIADTMAKAAVASPQDVASSLIEQILSRAKPQQDNCTVVIARAGGQAAGANGDHSGGVKSGRNWIVLWLFAVTAMLGIVFYIVR